MNEQKPNLPTTDYKNASSKHKANIEKGLGDFFCRFFRIKTPRDDTPYFYVNGIYRDDGEQIVCKLIHDYLGGTETTHLLSEVLSKIRNGTRFFGTVDEMLEKTGEQKYDICVENGILNLQKGEMKSHTPDEVFITKIPVKHDPNAKCEKIEKFLKEITGNHEPNEDKCKQLEEIAGWCLLPDYHPQVAIALIGPGSNSKSTFILLLKNFLGQKNCTSISLHELEEEPFARGNLHGKLANLYPDLDRRAIEHTGIFKQLTGGDFITGDRKFRDRIDFQNRAKMIFSSNLLPHFKGDDDTDAFFRRWIRIDFLRQFTKEKGNENPHILDELCTPDEFSGFLNLAIKGAQRLIQNGQFTADNITIEEKRERFLAISDIIPLFLEKAVVQAPSEYMTRRDFYLLFKAFLIQTKSEFMHERNMTQTKFTRDVKSLIQHNPAKYGWLTESRKALPPSMDVVDIWKGVTYNLEYPGLCERYVDLKEDTEMDEKMEKIQAKPGDQASLF